MKPFFLFGFLLLASTFRAQVPPIITEHGYRFYHHINKGGQKAKRGETIRAYVNVFIGDTLLSSSRKNLSGTYKFDIAPEGAALDHYPPLMDAALLMGIGDSATIFQPLDTAMRRFVPKEVRNEKELRFEIALAQIVSVEDKAKVERAIAAQVSVLKQKVQLKIAEYTSGALNGQLTSTKSGLKMLVLQKGQGNPVKQGETVQVHYFGFLSNGTSFDNSFERRQPMAFPAGMGQMIPGFDEGVLLLSHGSKAYLFIPGNLGYGENEGPGGLIPADAELVFYIEIL